MVAISAPARARRFFSGFAQTKAANSAEALARGLVGLAFIGSASHLRIGLAGRVLGYFLVVTGLLMLVFPGAHRAIAASSVAWVGGRMRLIGAASILLALALAALLLRSAVFPGSLIGLASY